MPLSDYRIRIHYLEALPLQEGRHHSRSLRPCECVLASVLLHSRVLLSPLLTSVRRKSESLCLRSDRRLVVVKLWAWTRVSTLLALRNWMVGVQVIVRVSSDRTTDEFGTVRLYKALAFFFRVHYVRLGVPCSTSVYRHRMQYCLT